MKNFKIKQLFSTISCRRFCNCVSINATNEIKSENYGKAGTARNVQNILKLKYREALNIVNENDKLIKRDSAFLSKNYQILSSYGVEHDTILKYPQLLAVPYLDELITDLKILLYSLNITIILACLEKPLFEKFISRYRNNDDKIDLLSETLQVSHQEACEILLQKTFLIGLDPQLYTKKLKLILDFGIKLKEIRKDLWVLRYRYELLENRIQVIKKCETIISRKPWMLRSPIDIVLNYGKRRIENREILGNNSLTEYLSKNLECTEDQAKYLISRMPALATKSVRTLSTIINFLYSKGFQPCHIYRVPKILVHSVETTKNRLEQLNKEGIEIDSLYMLTKSQKQFNQFVETSIKAKKTN